MRDKRAMDKVLQKEGGSGKNVQEQDGAGNRASRSGEQMGVRVKEKRLGTTETCGGVTYRIYAFN